MDTNATDNGTQVDELRPVDEKPKRKRGPYKKTTERQMAAALLMDAGMQPEIALEQLGYSPKSVNGVKQRIKEKKLVEFVTPKRLKSATKTIDSLMAGRPVGEIAVVKDSTALAAAGMVLDRAYPKQSESGPASVSFTTINLTLAQVPKPTVYMEAHDVTPTGSITAQHNVVEITENAGG